MGHCPGIKTPQQQESKPSLVKRYKRRIAAATALAPFDVYSECCAICGHAEGLPGSGGITRVSQAESVVLGSTKANGSGAPDTTAGFGIIDSTPSFVAAPSCGTSPGCFQVITGFVDAAQAWNCEWHKTERFFSQFADANTTGVQSIS